MNLLREFVRVIVEATHKGRLRVFDFDDTLVKTDARVGVRNELTGESFLLTPGEYATYEKQSGDAFDYSEFNELINPQEIYWTGQILRKIYYKYGPEGVVILTARGTPAPARKFLEDAGFPGIEIVALGTSDPMAKANWIDQRIRRDKLTLVEFFDDSRKNIDAVLSIRDSHPGVKVIVRHIVH